MYRTKHGKPRNVVFYSNKQVVMMVRIGREDRSFKANMLSPEKKVTEQLWPEIPIKKYGCLDGTIPKQ